MFLVFGKRAIRSYFFGRDTCPADGGGELLARETLVHFSKIVD